MHRRRDYGTCGSDRRRVRRSRWCRARSSGYGSGASHPRSSPRRLRRPDTPCTAGSASSAPRGSRASSSSSANSRATCYQEIIHESLSLTYNHYNYDSNVPRRRTRGGHNVRHNRRPAPRRRRRWRQPRRHGSRFDDAHVVHILGARHIVAVYAQRRRRRRRYRGDVERVVERVEERRTRR